MTIHIEVINLKESTARLKKIDKVLSEEGLTYHRQEAINGYEINFHHRQSNKKFTGKELAENKIPPSTHLENWNKYKVKCDPSDKNPTEFIYNGFGINAGQMGSLCSHVKIWAKAHNNYEHTLILQDNFTPVSGFATKLNNLMENLPDTYDFVFLNIAQSAGELLPVEGNEYLKTFSSNAKWHGNAGIIISQKGIDKLLQDYNSPFNAPADKYYHKYATCQDRKADLACAILPKTFSEPSEAYMAAETLIVHSGEKSVTETMGEVRVIADEF